MVVRSGNVLLTKEQKHLVAQMIVEPTYPDKHAANMAFGIMRKMGYKGATVQQARDFGDGHEWEVSVVECESLGHNAYTCDQTNHPKG